MKTYGIVSTKGGVGKTSFSGNFGAMLADMGQRVLLVDGDFQQSLSSYYQIIHKAPYGLTKLITQKDPSECISHTSVKNLDIVLSDDVHGKLLEWLRESYNHPYFLAAALAKLKNDYDIVIIDSQGARSIMQQSIILASDELIGPIVPGPMESREFFRGTIEMLDSMKPIDGLDMPGPKIPNFNGIIFMQARTNDSKAIAMSIRKEFFAESGGTIKVLSSYIPLMSSYVKASARQLPVHRLEVCRKGPTLSAHDAYLSVVHELLPHLADTIPQWSNGDRIAKAGGVS